MVVSREESFLPTSPERMSSWSCSIKTCLTKSLSHGNGNGDLDRILRRAFSVVIGTSSLNRKPTAPSSLRICSLIWFCEHIRGFGGFTRTPRARGGYQHRERSNSEAQQQFPDIQSLVTTICLCS